MLKFSYWSNKTAAHDKLLYECEAENILEADKLFERETKLNPIKNPWIGVTIDEIRRQND